MAELNPLLLPTMLELLREGAGREYIQVSTTALAKKLGQSQQAASLHLVSLESEGLIERRRIGAKNAVKMTTKGLDAVRSFTSEIKSALDEVHEFVFHGKVFEGLGEGAYYIGLEGYKKQMAGLLGFGPFPGTLNLKLESPSDVDKKRQLHFRNGLRVEGFSSGGRTYGGASCYKAVINDTQRAALLVIDRTHYDDTVLELVAPVRLRDALGLRDGQELKVAVTV